MVKGQGGSGGSKSVDLGKLVQLVNGWQKVIRILKGMLKLCLEQVGVLVVVAQYVAIFAKANEEAHVPVLIAAFEQAGLE